MDRFEIRKAVLDDVKKIMSALPDIIRFLRESGNPQWNGETYPLEEHFVADINKDILWVAIDKCADEEDIAGFVAISKDQPPEYSNVNWGFDFKVIVPHRLAITPKYRGQGIAQLLLRKCEKIAHLNDCKLIRADTSERNQPMRHIFSKEGYIHRGNITWGKYGSDYDEMQFMCFEKLL